VFSLGSKQLWDSQSATKEQEATEEQMHELNFPPAIYSQITAHLFHLSEKE